MNILYPYIRLVLFIVVVCLLLGFVLPSLFSASSTFAVLVGIGLIFAVPVVVWRWKEVIRADFHMWKHFFFTKETTNENKED